LTVTRNLEPDESESYAQSYEWYINALREYDRELDELILAVGPGGESAGHSGLRRNEDEALRNLRLAREKVGHSDESRARWLLQFANTELTRLLPGQRLDLEWEILAFAASPFLEVSHFLVDHKGKIQVPVDELHGFVRGGIRYLAGEGDGTAQLSDGTPIPTWMPEVGFRPRLVRIKDRLIVDSGSDVSFSFKAAVVRVLTSQAERFRFCRTCGQSFIARRRQVYCRPTCSQTFRTRKFRAKDPDQTRAKRREAYERLRKKKIGPNVKIGHRISRQQITTDRSAEGSR
jgi:hypothetical protein